MELGELVLKLGVEGGVVEGTRECLQRSPHGEHLGHSRPIFLQSFGLRLVGFGFKPRSSKGAGGGVPALHRPWRTDGPFWLMVRFVLLHLPQAMWPYACNNECTWD